MRRVRGAKCSEGRGEGVVRGGEVRGEASARGWEVVGAVASWEGGREGD